MVSTRRSKKDAEPKKESKSPKKATRGKNATTKSAITTNNASTTAGGGDGGARDRKSSTSASMPDKDKAKGKKRPITTENEVTVEVHKKKVKGKEREEALQDMDIDDTQSVDMVEEDENEVIESIKLEESDAESDEDDDSIDWETVQLPPRFDPAANEEENKPVYNDVEIVMEAPRPVLKKSHWEMAYQRNLRQWTHNCHALTLLAHFKLRNRWCSQPVMESACALVVPDHAKQQLSKSTTKLALTTGLKWLLKWWSEYFTITGPGLVTRPYSDFAKLKENLRTLLDSKESTEETDYIENIEGFIDRLVNIKSGTRDTCAELFVAILRYCGLEARLVCSLQPLSYKIPSTPAVTKQPAEEDPQNEDEKENSIRFKYRTSKITYEDPNVKLKQPRAKPPAVWAEVYCADIKSWMCVDPIRGLIDAPAQMEPAALDRQNNMSYVLALDPVNSKGQGNITDVTRRYTSNLEKAVRLRERPLTKREKEGGMKLWSTLLLDGLKFRIGDRELLEQHELDHLQKKEVMPTAIGNFKNHPLYALERHLLKFEVIHPKDHILGSIRGEKIYPRDCVKTVSTADTYRKMGREIIEGEQPIKMVKANAVILEKRRMQERAKQEGHEMMVACYGEWQTKPYVPEPIIDGKIVKNAFGNIDLFTPSMLPQGAAHIPIKGIGKMAKKLGIDYADAVVDFEFVKMRSVPVIDGIVVAEHSKYILLEAWEEHEKNEALKAIAKQEKDVYVRWRKLIKGLLIKARVDNDYGKSKDEASTTDQIWASIHDGKKDSDEEGGGGGFLPEDA